MIDISVRKGGVAMRRMFAVLLTIFWIFTFVIVTEAQQQQAPEITEAESIVGFYECQGQSFNEVAYKGFAEIIKFHDTFRVHWMLDDGGEFWGVGIFSNGILTVGYFGGAPAVVVYKIDGNRLIGEWTMLGFDGKTYPDILTKTDKRPVVPLPQTPSVPSEPLKRQAKGKAV